MKQTCETCDWWCYGTYPDATCDKWEQTVYEVPVPDDVISQLLRMPTKKDIEELEDEIKSIEDRISEIGGG